MAKYLSEKPGFHFGRYDLERIGLFSEPSYMNGLGWTPTLRGSPLDRLKGGKPFEFEFPKWKVEGLQDCYFDKKFKRMMEGEPIFEAEKAYLREQSQNAKKGGRALFLPPGTTKWHSTPGDLYGSFTKEQEAFSPLTRPKPKLESSKPFTFQIPKQGGYGNADITFDKYPTHSEDYYNAGHDLYIKRYKEHVSKFRKGLFYHKLKPERYFEPNPYTPKVVQPTYKEIIPPKEKKIFQYTSPAKKIAGNVGLFDKYPKHDPEPYLTAHQVDKVLTQKLNKNKPTRDSGLMKAVHRSRQHYIKPVVNYNVEFKVNAKNWPTATPITYPNSMVMCT